jgi:hypothetical protein
VKGEREFKLSPAMDRLRDKKEVWLNVFLMGKILMLKQKKIPSGFSMGYDYSDIRKLKERTLDFLIPNFQALPEHLRRDCFDFFTMAIFNPKVSSQISQ